MGQHPRLTMRFGINTWAWNLPVDASNFDAFLEWAESLGIPGENPVIEVFASPDAADLPFAAEIRAKAADHGFGVVACGFNPYMAGPNQPNPHLVSPDADERKAAIARARGFISYAAAVATHGDPGVLSGPWHTRHTHFTGAGMTAQERAWLVEGLGEIARHAGDLGVLAGFEILNRFETYVITSVSEALDIIGEVGHKNLGFNWDTSHAHIDEAEDVVPNLDKAARSGHLFHVHLSENHRREYGTGKIGPRTAEILKVLRDADYKLGVVPELFCEALDPAIHKWNRTEGDPDGAARRSIAFLRGMI
jgi:D-psicose/D-tagatose/L-ribulose 3-epimerase